MVRIGCSFPECNYVAEHDDSAIVASLLNIHCQTHAMAAFSLAARAQGKAETCMFTTTAKCQCSQTIEVDYTTESVRDVLLSGIADLDIRREALSNTRIQSLSINEVISFVESREMARNATPSASMSAMSSFRKKQNEPPPQKKNLPPDANKLIPCPDCKKNI